MSVKIAQALTSLGSRVCIVDLDLAFGDVAITLQLIPSHTLADAAGFEDQLDWSMLQEHHHRAPHRSVRARRPHQPEGRERITAPLVRRVLGQLREHFDHVVVDTPPGFDDQVLGAFDETDEVVVVATLDVPTIKNVKVAIETLDLLHLVRDHRHLVLNRADQEVGLTTANVAELLGVPVDLTLPATSPWRSRTTTATRSSPRAPDHVWPAPSSTSRVASRGSRSVPRPSSPAGAALFRRRRKEVAR